MKFCIFNSLSVHYEMFSYILDYCKENNEKIDIYTNRENNYGWLDFYEKRYSIHTWYPISFFDPNAYDYVFLLTDDDFYPYFDSSFTAKVIVIEHNGMRQLPLNAFSFLQTRQFKLRNPQSNPNTWIMPLWNNVFHEKYEKLTVLSVGNASNLLDLKELFINFNDIHFILIDRYMDCSDSESITKYNSLDTNLLIEYAAKSHYILFWPTTEFSQNHKYNSMSASFPLGYSVGTPLIVPESYIEPYGLRTLTGLECPISLEKPSREYYDKFLKERKSLLTRRNYILDSIFVNNI